LSGKTGSERENGVWTLFGEFRGHNTRLTQLGPLCRGRPSECLRQAGLFERVVRPVPRFDSGVHHEAPLGDRAVPDLVVAFAVAFKVAAGGAQQTFDRGREVVGHSRRNRRPLMPLRQDREGDVAPMIGRQQAVRFEQLGDHHFQLLDQRIQCLGAGGEAWHVVACCDPDRGVGVPGAVHGIGCADP
jgi:hypothetical protein